MSIAFASIPQLERDPASSVRGDAACAHPDDRAVVHALIERSRDGDAVAFGEVYDLFEARIHRYLLARVGWNRSDAEDLLAETFIDAWRAVPRYQWTGAPFLAWLFTIAGRRGAMHHRAASRRPVAASGERRTEELADETDAIGAVHRRIHLTQLLAQLTGDQRTVLELRFFGSLTTAEIAAVLRRSADAVRQLQLRALTELRGLPGAQELVL